MTAAVNAAGLNRCCSLSSFLSGLMISAIYGNCIKLPLHALRDTLYAIHMFREFRKFILRGNAVDLAVGIVIGAAFTSIVNSLVKGIISPLIAVFYDGTEFAKLSYNVRGQEFAYGDVMNNAISFLIVAAVVFFLVVQPINHLTERVARSKETDEPSTRKCPECLSEIHKEATRCKFCTAKIPKS